MRNTKWGISHAPPPPPEYQLPIMEGRVPAPIPKYLSNSQVVPLQILIASIIPNNEEWSYRRRKISNKQSNKTLHHSSTSTDQLESQTTMQYLLDLPTRATFDGCMTKQCRNRFVSRILLYQRYQNIHSYMNN